MNAKYTPGPWFPIEYCGFQTLQTVDYYDEQDLLDADSVGEDTAIANGKLASTAPELLEALQDLIQLKNWKEKNGKDEHYLKLQPIMWQNAIDIVNKAIGQ